MDADAENVKNGFVELGANKTDIQIYEDVSYNEIKAIKNKIKQDIVINWASGQKTLCFVYYAGHGVMDNMTYAVCNQADKKTIYPLQGQLKALSQEPGAYIIGIFDCCREKITQDMRGNSSNPPIDEDENDHMNHIFWFGCQENGGVSADSTIAVDFFKEVKSVANSADGSVRLPTDMLFWRPGGSGNMINCVQANLKLFLKGYKQQVNLDDSSVTLTTQNLTRIDEINQDREKERLEAKELVPVYQE